MVFKIQNSSLWQNVMEMDIFILGVACPEISLNSDEK